MRRASRRSKGDRAHPQSIEAFDDINTADTTSKTAAEKILTKARLIQENLSTQVEVIVDEILKLKEDAAQE